MNDNFCFVFHTWSHAPLFAYHPSPTPHAPKSPLIEPPPYCTQASVGAVVGGVDLLLAAGFEERDGGDQLELGRQDPGLIWLAKSTVEAWQERLSPAEAP